jgi:23S rRNA (uracil1939-C5)-methyltransferase
VEVLRPAPERVSPPCPYFGTCGGCQFQHLAYAEQVRWKTALVRRQLQRIGQLESPPVRPTIAAPHPWAYRNQARFSLDREGRLCFTRPQSHWRLRIAECQIVQPEIATVMPRLQGALPRGHQIVVRYGARTGQFLIAPHLPALEGELETGQSSYEERFLGQTYRVSGPSFFQVNTRVDALPRPDLEASRAGRPPDLTVPWGPAEEIWASWVGNGSRAVSQAELLALLVLDRLQLGGGETVVDAYGGVGTFALQIARKARRVIGIEEAKPAVEDARHNARGFDNVELLLGRSEERIGEIGVRPDAVVLDPARVGAAPEVLKTLEVVRPATLVYVSCDPATLARDLARLAAAYRLAHVRAFDLFPQTAHVETVALLEKLG